MKKRKTDGCKRETQGLVQMGGVSGLEVPNLDSSIQICPFLSLLGFFHFSGISQFFLSCRSPLSGRFQGTYKAIPEKIWETLSNFPDKKKGNPLTAFHVGVTKHDVT